MKRQTLSWFTLLMAAMLLPGRAAAEDTDLFASTRPSQPADILLIFDNGASFSASTGGLQCSINASTGAVAMSATPASPTALGATAGAIEQCAMYSALKSIEANDQIKIGMMMFNAGKIFDPDSGANGAFTGSCNGTVGGCVVLPMRVWSSKVKANTLEWIRQWQSSGGSNYNVKGPSSTSNGGIMQEAYAFFKGKMGISGVQYTAVETGCGASYIINIGNSFLGNTSPGDFTGNKGPKDPFFGNGTATSANKADPLPSTAEKDYLTKLGTLSSLNYKVTLGNDPRFMSCTKGSQNSFNFTSAAEGDGAYGVSWAKYMLDQHGIQTTSIGLLGPSCNPNYSTFLDALGTAGGKGFVPTNDMSGLSFAVSGAISNIIASNTVFASVSLPVTVNLQSQFLNQVFIGMFRPDAEFNARWWGNLKQYKLAFTDAAKTDIKLVDAGGNDAINSTTGFMKVCTRSFWTPSSNPSGTGYWALDPKGACTDVTDSKNYDSPDGNIVEKGAQAYRLRQLDPGNRVVKTCGATMATCTSTLSDFNTSASLSPTLFGLGSADTATRDTYVNWARGARVKTGETAQPTIAANEMRPSVHGDVIHSRPVAVDYGTGTGVVVFYGANDGMLRAINGNQSTGNISGKEPGDELWAFMPPEFYGNIAAQYDNSKFVFYKGTPRDSTATLSKPYGMDGPMTAIKGTFGGSTKTYLFATMRRGGRAVYAFDVTSPTNPSLVWKKGCSSALLSGSDCSAGTGNDYTNIGQTWAPAKEISASQVSAGAKPLLLMGGGYDTCEDTDTGTANHSCTSAKGSQVYVIDASDGSIVRSFPTVAPWTGGAPRGVVSEATVVKNSDGTAKYAYIADMGGVVYRISFAGAATTDWTMTPIAKLGCDSLTACSANRKFMSQASVVSPDNGTTFYILVGGGDREKPTRQYTASNAVANAFFMVKDQPSTANYLDNACGTGNNFSCLSSLYHIPSSGSVDSTALTAAKGWYLSLDALEQVVTGALTQFGITTFSTHTPAPLVLDSCGSDSLGMTRVYNINFADASAANGGSRFDDVAGDGLPPSPVAGTVDIDGTVVPFCIGCSKDSPLEAKKSKQATLVTRAKNRLFWYLQKN